VPEPPVPSSFLDALRDLVAWLESSHTRAIVIGGVAASLLGRPRATRDVGVLALVPEDRWEEFLHQGEQFGFRPGSKSPWSSREKPASCYSATGLRSWTWT